MGFGLLAGTRRDGRNQISANGLPPFRRRRRRRIAHARARRRNSRMRAARFQRDKRVQKYTILSIMVRRRDAFFIIPAGVVPTGNGKRRGGDQRSEGSPVPGGNSPAAFEITRDEDFFYVFRKSRVSRENRLLDSQNVCLQQNATTPRIITINLRLNDRAASVFELHDFGSYQRKIITPHHRICNVSIKRVQF